MNNPKPLNLTISIKPSICKYHIYSSLRTHLNLNGDNSLKFKPTLQVPQIVKIR